MRKFDLEGEFLPDWDYHRERRSSPFAQRLPALIGIFVICAVAWAAWTTIDYVVVARGEVEPVSQVRLINHPTGGRITAIHVRAGETVEKDALLVTFDQQDTSAEIEKLTSQLQNRQADIIRLKAQKSDQPLAFPHELASARPDLVKSAMSLHEAHKSKTIADRQALVNAAEHSGARIKVIEADQQRLQNDLDLLTQQYEAVKDLSRKGLYPKLKIVQVERQLSESRGQLAASAEEFNVAKSGLNEAKARLDAFDERIRLELVNQIEKLAELEQQLQDEIGVLQNRFGTLELRAPVAGRIQDLQVQSIGQSIAGNQPIMSVVPSAEGVVISARLPDENGPDVYLGQPATIRVQQNAFTEQARLDGTVTLIDAEAQRRAPGEEALLGVRIVSEGQRYQQNGEWRALVPGMEVDVELKVSERTLLSFVVNPILTFSEGLDIPG